VTTAVTAVAPIPGSREMLRTLVCTTSPPCSCTFCAQRSHIIPGPSLGYSNSSISDVMSFWLRLGSTALTTALSSDRFLIRWAAQSDCNSLASRPHSFSV